MAQGFFSWGEGWENRIYQFRRGPKYEKILTFSPKIMPDFRESNLDSILAAYSVDERCMCEIHLFFRYMRKF